MKFKCDNCDGKGKIFNYTCDMCEGEGTIGLLFWLIDWYLKIYYIIWGQLFVIKHKIKQLFL